jgi:hypothetical protein
VTREGSAKEYFGAFAEYVNPDDIEDIACGIQRAISRPLDLLAMIYVRANFTWEQSTTSLLDEYEYILHGTSQKSIESGFSTIENDEYRLFAWSYQSLSFSIQPGILSWTWRSVNGAEIDIFIDGALLQQAIFVGSSWSRYAIEAPSSEDFLLRKLKFEVRGKSAETSTKETSFGIAMAEVSWVPLVDPPKEMGLAVTDVPFIKNINNFYPTEQTDTFRYTWTRTEFDFECEAGQLEFIWRSLDDAEVDIFVNDVLVRRAETVSSNWEPYSLSIKGCLGYYKVKMTVKAVHRHVEHEWRELALALSSFTLKEPHIPDSFS